MHISFQGCSSYWFSFENEMNPNLLVKPKKTFLHQNDEILNISFEQFLLEKKTKQRV